MKRDLSQLGIFGGTPDFREPLHVGRPFTGDRHRLIGHIEQALDNHRLTNHGPFVKRFEEALRNRLEIEHVVPVANGTLGIMVLLKALGLEGEVLLPSYTYIASAHAVQWQGLQPIFCEVDPATHTLDPGYVRDRITSQTAAIMGVHLWGRPCAIDQLEAIARDAGVPLIFDAAHAFNVSWNGRRIGGFGEAEVFSFHATKFVNSLEGGAVTTSDAALAREVRQMIDFGYSQSDEIMGLGINGKMSEFHAAMGLATLSDIDEILAVNRDTYEAYLKELGRLPGLSLKTYDESQTPNYQYITVELEADSFGLSRDTLIQLLQAENVLARAYFHPGCHRLPPYSEQQINLPKTESVSDRTICLPCGAAMTPGIVARVADLLGYFHENAPGIVDHTGCGSVSSVTAVR